MTMSGGELFSDAADGSPAELVATEATAVMAATAGMVVMAATAAMTAARAVVAEQEATAASGHAVETPVLSATAERALGVVFFWRQATPVWSGCRFSITSLSAAPEVDTSAI